MNNSERIQELEMMTTHLIQEYKDLPPYEIANQLIVAAVSILLYTAPDKLLAFKVITASIEHGINDYEECAKMD